MIKKYCNWEIRAKNAVPPLEVWGVVDAKNEELARNKKKICKKDKKFRPGWLTDRVSDSFAQLLYFKMSSFQ